MAKPLFTSPLLRLKEGFWASRRHWTSTNGISLCDDRMQELWNLDRHLPIKVVLTSHRTPNSYRIRLIREDQLGFRDRILIEGKRRSDVLLLSDEFVVLIAKFRDEEDDLFVAVDIIEQP
jgi:hypothetical protein